MDKFMHFYFFITIMVNVGLSSFFKASKCYRQDDPLSLLLFIIVMEAFNKTLCKTKELEMFKGLKVGDGEHTKYVTHLVFTDGNLLFCEPKERAPFHFICILLSFEVVFKFNNNSTKFELGRLGDEIDANRLTRILRCRNVKLSIRYLRLQLGVKLKRCDNLESCYGEV